MGSKSKTKIMKANPTLKNETVQKKSKTENAPDIISKSTKKMIKPYKINNSVAVWKLKKLKNIEASTKILKSNYKICLNSSGR